MKEAVGAANLLKESRLGSLSEHRLGTLHALLFSILLALSSFTLGALGLLLTLVGSGGLLLSEVFISESPELGVFCIPLDLELGTLIPELAEVVTGSVLLSLDDVEFGLKSSVFLAQLLGLGSVQAVLDLLDLGLVLVNQLLLLLKAAKQLLLLAEVGDLVKRLLLINKLHHAGVNIALETGNLLLEFLQVLDGQLGTVGLALVDKALHGLFMALDLVELGSAILLATTLLFLDLVEALDELLSANLGWILGLLVLSGSSKINLVVYSFL